MTSQYNLLDGIDTVDYEDATTATIIKATESSDDQHEAFDIDRVKKYMRKKKYKFQAIKNVKLPKKLPVYQSCREYIISKDETTILTDMPDTDTKCMRPSLEYILEIRRKHDNEEMLAQIRRKAQIDRRDLDAQWRRLAHDENELKINFIRFNKFVKENLEKRERAAKKIVYDVELKDKRTNEVNILKEKMQEMKVLRGKIERTVKQYRIFETYLSTVLRCEDQGGTFKTVDAIVNRYESIIDTKRQLAEMQEQKLKEIEQIKQKLVRAVKNYQLKMLGLTTKRCGLLERYTCISEIAKAQELAVEKIENSANAIVCEIASVKLSIQNLFVTMCQRRDTIPHLDMDDYESLSLYIKKCFEETVKAESILEQRMTVSQLNLLKS